MKKILLPLVILLIGVFIITGCSSGASPSSTPAATTPAATSPAATSPSATATTPAGTTQTTPTSTQTSPTASVPAEGKYGGMLRIIEVTAPGAPIGAEWEGNASTYMTQQWVLERLLKEKLDGTMQAELAESWEVNSTGDNPYVILHLRKGVKFHDGSDFNAQAVKWNLDMFKNGGLFGSTTNFWKSYEILDDYTIKINYTIYRNTLIRSFENYFIVSPSAYEKNGIEWLRTHMVGTAAFAQTDFQRDVLMSAEKVSNYWQQGRPYLDGVQLLYVADELTREALFRSGGAEMLNASPKVASNFKNTDNVILTRSSGTTVLLPDSMNADSPWSNIKVRMAAEYAIDRDAMASAFGYGMSQAAFQMAGPTTLAFDPALESKYRKYDVAKAKQLLTEAGYPNGFKTKIQVQTGVDRDPIVAVQAYLAKIGIQAELSFPEPASWQSVMVGPVPSNTLLWVVVGEVSNYNTTLNIFFAEPGAFYFKSLKKPEGWAELFAKTLTTPAPDPQVLKEVGNAFFDDCTVIPINYPPFVYVMSPKVQDSGLTKFGTSYAWDYPNVWLEK